MKIEDLYLGVVNEIKIAKTYTSLHLKDATVSLKITTWHMGCHFKDTNLYMNKSAAMKLANAINRIYKTKKK